MTPVRVYSLALAVKHRVMHDLHSFIVLAIHIGGMHLSAVWMVLLAAVIVVALCIEIILQGEG